MWRAVVRIMVAGCSPGSPAHGRSRRPSPDRFPDPSRPVRSGRARRHRDAGQRRHRRDSAPWKAPRSGAFVFAAVRRRHLHDSRRDLRLQPARAAQYGAARGRDADRRDLKLQVGGITETVTLTAQGSLVQTQSSDRSALLTSDQMQLLGAAVATSSPSSAPCPVSRTSRTPTRSAAVSGRRTPNIGGNRNTMNSMTVDGQMSNDLGSPQIFSSTTNLDAIGEVSVELNNYRAEHGRNAGAVVNIVTKSGTRDSRAPPTGIGGTSSSTPTTFSTTRTASASRSIATAPRASRRRARAEAEGAAVLLLLLRGPQHADAAAAAHRHGADRGSSAPATSRRAARPQAT